MPCSNARLMTVRDYRSAAVSAGHRFQGGDLYLRHARCPVDNPRGATRSSFRRYALSKGRPGSPTIVSTGAHVALSARTTMCPVIRA